MRFGPAFLIVAAVGSMGCDPVAPVEMDRVVVVATPRVSVSSLRERAQIVFVVTPHGPQSVAEVRAWVPSGAELVSNMLISSENAPRALRRVVKEANGLSRWDGGELSPGQSQMFGIVLRDPDALLGDTLLLPVQLVMSDGSLMDWTDPDDADRPAPRIPVVRPGFTVPPTAALLVAGVAVGVLLLAGGQALRGRRERA